MTLQTVASLTSVIMTLANAKAKTNETFIVQVSLTIITYDRQNMFIVQATDPSDIEMVPIGCDVTEAINNVSFRTFKVSILLKK